MQDNCAIVRNFLDVVLTQGRIELTDQFFWDDVVELTPLPGQGPGLAGLKDFLQGMRTAFPDMQWTVHEQIAQGDKVVTRFEWTGTHQATFFGVPATGRPVKIWGIVIDHFQGSKIKETQVIMDALGLMTQLGKFPAA